MTGPLPEDHLQKTTPRPLRWGFSTGTAAAAAAKAALLKLLGQPCPEAVEVSLPAGGSLVIPLHTRGLSGDCGEAGVIKDAGDDPDVTHGALIGARVGWANGQGSGEAIRIAGGEGVGRVTKPGLVVPVGEPAINPVPRKMLRQALRQVWKAAGPPRPLRVKVEIFVPRGEELARHTLNPRLGILGGISILGTTGLVKPFSHAAYRATVLAGLRVARALGLTTVVFSTGGKSEDLIREYHPDLPLEAFVQMGDYVEYALRQAGRLGFSQVLVAAFLGKALKIAQGFRHTHASQGLINFTRLGRWVLEKSGNATLAQEVARANTARHALDLLIEAGDLRVLEAVGPHLLARLRSYAGPSPTLSAVILDFDGRVLWQGQEP